MITLEKLKRYLNIQDDAQDTLLQECIDAAAAYSDSYTGRKLLQADYTEHVQRVYSNFDERIFYVKNYPVIAVNKVEYCKAGQWIEIDKSKINYESDKIIITDAALSEFDKYRASYTAGYDAKILPEGEEVIKQLDEFFIPMPADLENAMKKLSAEYYYDSAAGDNRQGVTTRNWSSQGSEGISFKSVLQEVNQILNRFREVKI